MLFCYAECHYTEFIALFIILLNVNMPSAIMLNVVMLNVVILSVVAPLLGLGPISKTFYVRNLRTN